MFNRIIVFLDKHKDNIFSVSVMDCDKEVRILPLVVLEKNNPSYESIEKIEILGLKITSVDN